MYLLVLPNNVDTLSVFSRKQRKDKGSKRLSKKTNDYNTKFLYKNMFGGDKAVNAMAKTGIPKNIAKQYHMDMAKQYNDDLNTGKDVNVGLSKVNKKYNKYFK